ncbi:TIGR02680 family protein [Gordonia phthalatica]|uniref:TIGR02680 family protein n=1 Tax=Gordonia phthalatica TaxID=1136941 RepID=A0A0N9MS58_9ACTN|nr:TIGR02680 family protein [Gordonia phthalatica]ALG85310.1 hypothetical protein ACH46_13540 [Gordonia phthalatica]
MTESVRSTPVPDSLPSPTLSRWQPLRLGLVDLFYYDDEQFWFHDGRLLLRGNNGTGKSKVLALTLPFLLDGSIVSRRVEPDADPKKKMDWNLLLGGAHPQSERTGYTWAEFGRIDDDGVEHFTTIGIGLKAASGRGIVKQWFFVTSQRIGEQLLLVDEHRTVLTPDRLRDALEPGSGGQVYTTQEQYRRAVDEAMFGLGADRYSALIDLLIQLRQPQLSKRPDEKALSSALTEALAPPSQALIADVAESFRSLDEERVGIAAARQTLTAAEGFLRHYRGYSAVASKRATTDVRLAHSAYEGVGRELHEAQEQRAAALASEARLDAEKVQTQERLGALRGQEQALRASPEMKDADSLDRAARSADEAKGRAEAAATQAAQSRERAERDQAAAQETAERHAHTAEAHQRNAAAALTAAAAAGMATEHPSVVDDEQAARRALDRRREQIRHVRGLIRDADRATAAAAQQRSRLDSAESDLARRAEALHSEVAGVETAVEAYRDAVREMATGLSLISLDAEPDELVGHAQVWAESLDGESPVRAELDRSAARATERIHRDLADAESAERELTGQRDDTVAEIARLEAGDDLTPSAAPGRADDRGERPGAPLWRVADFAADLGDDARAGVEAALTSAGLLDAWIHPDGSVEADGDVVLGSVGTVVVPSAGSALVAAVGPDSEVSAATVDGVLDRIGWGADSGAALWIDGTGRWGAGPARGQWRKPRAEFVGAGAREAYRREQLAELRRRLDRISDGLAAATERVAAAERAGEQILVERGRYPSAAEHDVRSAHGRVAAAQREADAAQLRLAEISVEWEAAVERAESAAQVLHEQAAELSVPAVDSDVDVLDVAIADYDVRLVTLRSSATMLALAEAELAQAGRRAAETADLSARHTREQQEIGGQAIALRATYDELFATVGATVAELQERLATLATEMDAATSELDRLGVAQLAAAAESGTLAQRVVDLTARREESAATREGAIERLRLFIETGLLRVALPDFDYSDDVDDPSVRAAVLLSRAVDQRLDSVAAEDDQWARVQQRVSSAWTELTSQMAVHGHVTSMEQRGEILVARVRHNHEDVDVDVLAQRLSLDIDARERLLSAREREILENSLVNEAAAHLHELISTAEEQIDRMNDELAMRKTSTGMQLRVRWRERADGPAGLAAARAILNRSDATWTLDDRSAVGDFLQAQIAEVRDADPAGGWQEHLAQALDYRQWHRFAIDRRQNGEWRSASGPASGGERALVVSIPLFAAASAHYNSAGGLAPRLILLDEAFAGVDDDSRAKSLGLLATFDLDVVMTSEREWGCYPQVPGLSIAQLSRVEGVDAVGVTRWRWDGISREPMPEVDAAARAGHPVAVDADDATLFG